MYDRAEWKKLLRSSDMQLSFGGDVAFYKKQYRTYGMVSVVHSSSTAA